MKEATKDRHAERCESQGHEWEISYTIFPLDTHQYLQVYQQCKWCGIRRGNDG